MPSLSPNATPTSAMPPPPSPHRSGSGRPGATKRHSAQSASQVTRLGGPSPSSTGDQQHAPLHKQHAVRAGRHTKIVLPRNHSSGRNLAKLARQVQQQDESKRDVRRRSHEHEGDTEIRLPGSLDESRPPPMRRNLTAYQLPRANSHVKLKKNLSHGHLSRLQSGRSVLALSSTQQKAPLSPKLMGKKRPRQDVPAQEMDLHEQEVEILRIQRQGKPGSSKTAFAVGSAGDLSDNEGPPDMEGSGMQEDEWTEESASASPYSTRQNTANNSRRASANMHDRTVDKATIASPRELVRATLRTKVDAETHQAEIRQSPVMQTEQDSIETTSTNEEDDDDSEDNSEEEEVDDQAEEADEEQEEDSLVMSKNRAQEQRASIKQQQKQELPHPPPEMPYKTTTEFTRLPVESKAPHRSPLHAGRELNNPATRRILSSQHLPAPALISNISAMDDSHSSHDSPTASRRSSKSHLDNGSLDGEDELVSRFVPSTSHPAPSSGANTTMNTPRQSGFHTPTDEQMRRARGTHLTGGPASPGSTLSGSSGAATPALGRSRIELKMLGEKALADREAVAERAPIYPHHVYDRRNETLKSYLNAASIAGQGRAGGGLGPATGLTLGPEIFQGRFKAVNTELNVVLKFRDPVLESIERLRQCKDSKLNQRSSSSLKQAAASSLKTSRSAVTLSARHASKLSTSTTPPAPNRASATIRGDGPSTPVSSTPPTTSADHLSQSATPRRGVSFAGAPRVTDSSHLANGPVNADLGPDAIARQLWDEL